MAKNRAVRTGRSKEKFVQLFDFMTNSPAWLDLSGNSVKLLVHLVKMSKGNNGWVEGKHDNDGLFLSVRDAAKAVGISRNTASKAFEELVEHGFLRIVRQGHFDVKLQATVWRLTFQSYPKAGMGPTNEWRKWPTEQKQQAQKRATTGSISDHSVPKTEPVRPEKRENSSRPTGSITGPHIDIYQGGYGSGQGDNEVACVEEAIRSQLSKAWKALDARGRRTLASATGLTVDEVKQYLDGRLTLSIGKQMALRSASKEAA